MPWSQVPFFQASARIRRLGVSRDVLLLTVECIKTKGEVCRKNNDDEQSQNNSEEEWKATVSSSFENLDNSELDKQHAVTLSRLALCFHLTSVCLFQTLFNLSLFPCRSKRSDNDVIAPLLRSQCDPFSYAVITVLTRENAVNRRY